MIRFLSVFTLALCTLGLSAQTLSLVPDTTNVDGPADATEIVAYSKVYNNTVDTVQVHWFRYFEDHPGAWGSTSICDNNQCYLPNVNFSPQIVYIAPGAFSILNVHFTPEGVVGEGTVGIRIWVIGDSAATVTTGFYRAIAEEPVAINRPSENDKIRIYPNPAKDYILIKNLPTNQILTVEVYNIFGRKMLSFSQPASTNESEVYKFDIASLAKGIYMIRVFDDSMNVIYTKSLTKE